MAGSILPPVAATDPAMLLPQDLRSANPAVGPASASPRLHRHMKSAPLLVPEIHFSRSSTPSSTPPASPRFDHRRGYDSRSPSPSPVITVATASSPLNSFTAIPKDGLFVSSPSSFTSAPIIAINSAYTTSTHNSLKADQRSVRGNFISAPILPIIDSSSPDFSTPSSALSPTPSTVSRAPGQDPPSRPMSMSIDTAQWSHGPGSFPETIAAASGVDSTTSSISQRSSHEGDDPYGANISFVYANEKRFCDYHALFRSVPEKEKLIEDYGCALQKEILVQGRLYISEDHVCFNANIFGWVTNLVIAFSEITAIEKRMTAFVIPNAISIVTANNTKGHFFASFLSRDAAHDLLMAAWRKSFPCAANASVASIHYSNHTKNRSTLTVGDEDDDDARSFISGRDSRKNRHRRSFSNASQDDRIGDWNDDEEGDQSANGSGLRRRGSKRAAVKKLLKDVIAPIIPDDDRNSSLSPTGNKRTGRPRSVSELPPRPTSFDGAEKRVSMGGGTTRTSFDQDSLTPSFRPRSGTESFPARHTPMVNNTPAFVQHSMPVLNIPPTVSIVSGAIPAVAVAIKGHARTTCKCSKDGRHYANTYMTETYPGTVETMWKLLFDSNLSKEFLTSEAIKGADVQEEPWKETGATSTKTTRYTRWLGMPIGPKTTKAILTDVCESKNFDDYTTTVTTTSTPDVPSGGSFTTKVRTCITWAGPSQIQIVVTGAVEFTKSSWIKGQIEKGAAEGLTVHFRELNKTLRKYIAAHPADFPGPGSVATPATATTTQTSQSVVVVPQPVQIEAHPPTGQHSVGAEGEKPPHQRQSRSGPVSKSNPVGLLDGIGSILSKALGVFRSPGQENGKMDGSHLALILALAMVMLANMYIWFQISSVTAQIERIQGDLLKGQGPIHTTSKQQPKVHVPSAGASTEESFGSGKRADRPRSAWWDVEEDLREREYEEDAMWAWLTERQARHRQYRRANGYYRPTETMIRLENKKPRTHKAMENYDPNANEVADDYEEGKENEKEGGKPILSESNEAKLQARIQELQDQLLALERHTTALKVGTRAAELDREQDIPVEN